MQCLQCQQETPPQAEFCLECGTRLVLMCAQCDTELPPGAKFYLECGQPVGARPAMPLYRATVRARDRGYLNPGLAGWRF